MKLGTTARPGDGLSTHELPGHRRVFLSARPLNHRITELDENEAKGIVNGWAEMAMDGKIYVTAIRYYDDYVREDGAWRFTRRETAMYYYAPVTDLPAIYATPYRKLFRGESEEVVARRADLPEALPTYQASIQHPVPEANAVLGE